MNIADLLNGLKATGYPVAYSDFHVDDQNPHPQPPYLVYVFAYSDDLMADNINYADISNFQVELYTARKDLAAEKKVQDKLKELGLPYIKTGTWIDSEKVFQIIYEIQLIGA